MTAGFLQAAMGKYRSFALYSYNQYFPSVSHVIREKMITAVKPDPFSPGTFPDFRQTDQEFPVRVIFRQQF
jgi:hypothetical protein